MFPYKAAIFGLVTQSFALPTELPERLVGVAGFEPAKPKGDRFTVYYNSPSLPHSQIL